MIQVQRNCTSITRLQFADHRVILKKLDTFRELLLFISLLERIFILRNQKEGCASRHDILKTKSNIIKRILNKLQVTTKIV